MVEDDFSYLGSHVRHSFDDFKIRKALAWKAIRKLWRVWTSDLLTRKLKVRVFRTTVESVLLYGSECWSLTIEQTRRLDGAYTRLLRKALNEWYPITNEDLYGAIPKASKTVQLRRLRFAGHCYRRHDQPVRDLVLWTPKGRFRVGGQAKMTYPKRLLADTSYKSIAELSRCMTDRKEWKSLVKRLSG